MPADPRGLTPTDTANILGISTTRLRQLAGDGWMPFIETLKGRLYDPDVVEWFRKAVERYRAETGRTKRIDWTELITRATVGEAMTVQETILERVAEQLSPIAQQALREHSENVRHLAGGDLIRSFGRAAAEFFKSLHGRAMSFEESISWLMQAETFRRMEDRALDWGNEQVRAQVQDEVARDLSELALQPEELARRMGLQWAEAHAPGSTRGED